MTATPLDTATLIGGPARVGKTTLTRRLAATQDRVARHLTAAHTTHHGPDGTNHA